MAKRKLKIAAKPRKRRKSKDILIPPLLARHFRASKPEDLCISERQFPFRVRADLQGALDKVLGDDPGVKYFCGVRQQMHAFDGTDFPSLMMRDNHYPPVAVPPQYEEIDIGEEKSVRCLKIGLWLMERDDERFAILLSPVTHHGQISGVQFQVAAFNTTAGAVITEKFFTALEDAVNQCRSYRGKILSLEEEKLFSGRSSNIKVHKLKTVARDQVILPRKTLDLLDRNVIQFVGQCPKLLQQGQSTKKGLLFYGAPGTGKSHTIHYLAAALKRHTTFLITAEQVSLLDEYMLLARLLQPAVVVIEDVDLIARERQSMRGNQESMLNRLLNEMDGLRPDADILFILTTNRPDVLEPALASRPGRIDQAIEFPLPDNEGREKLVRLYAGAATLSDDVLTEVVSRTENVSGAFIKELMRRSVQYQLENGNGNGITRQDVENALTEMLFSGGTLNVKLLGGNIGRNNADPIL